MYRYLRHYFIKKKIYRLFQFWAAPTRCGTLAVSAAERTVKTLCIMFIICSFSRWPIRRWPQTTRVGSRATLRRRIRTKKSSVKWKPHFDQKLHSDEKSSKRPEHREMKSPRLAAAFLLQIFLHWAKCRGVGSLNSVLAVFKRAFCSLWCHCTARPLFWRLESLVIYPGIFTKLLFA
jgi:hypothetical protein